MKKLSFLYSSFISIAIAHGASDFVFVAEIPTYAPFKTQLSTDELLKKEYEYFTEETPASPGCAVSIEKQNYKIESKPWRGLFKAYDQEKADKAYDQKKADIDVLNFQEEKNQIQTIIDLFQKESFGTTAEESQKEAKDKLRIVLLKNRIESIFEVKNQSLKVPHDDENALVLRGVWEPKWVLNDEPVPIQRVREYMRDCLQNALDPSAQEEERQKWHKELERLMTEEKLERPMKEGEEEKKKTSNHVPYNELREYLRNAQMRNDFVQTFTKANPNARLYEATHDSDLVGLRVAPDKRDLKETLLGSTGLYTHYLSILNDLKSTGKELPNVLSTGYRIVYDEIKFENDKNKYAWIYQAIEEDRYARAAASSVDFRAAYIAEPNCLYLVPQGHISTPYSFLNLPDPKIKIKKNAHNNYYARESMSIICQMYKNDPKVTVHFDPTHPVWMKIPDRMLNFKTSKTPLNFNKFGQYDPATDQFIIHNLKQVKHALALSSKISQCPFNYRDYAITLYGQFNLYGTKRENVDLFRSLIITIFNHFDIKNLVEEKDRLLHTNYLKFGNITEKPENKILLDDIKKIKKLKSIDEQKEALKKFMNETYGNQMGDIAFRIAEKMKGARITHYKMFLRGDKALRMSPKQAIEHSPKQEIINIKKEDGKAEKKEHAPAPIKKEDGIKENDLTIIKKQNL